MPERSALPEIDSALDPAETEESSAELLERLLASADSYVNDVVEVYEASERNYRAAMTAGTVVNGLSDTTNF